MASIGAIAGIRDEAVKRLLAAAARIGEETGIPAPVFESFRQPDYQQAMQLKTLADWTESVAEWLAPPPAVEPEPEDKDEESEELAALGYEDMTVAELRALAEERGINLTANMKKADIISVLEHFDSAQRPADEPEAETEPEPESEAVETHETMHQDDDQG